MNFALRAMNQLLARQHPEVLAVDGARLQRIGDACWVADRELSYGRRSSLPVRMTVTRDRSGGLTLYSPVRMDEGTREALAGLGEVVRVLAPNRFHTLFVGRAMDAYPEAELLVPTANAGLADRFPNRTRVVDALQSISSDLEVLPVHLADGLVELCAYHDDSETLLLADLLFNIQQANSLVAKLFYRMNGVWQQPGNSRLQRLLLFKNAESLSRFYRWALAKPFSQIAMAHGQIISKDAREQFYQIFCRYGSSLD